MTMNSLPTQATTFVGRTEERAEIRRLLDDPACRLLTLVGAGGIGKTRLALQAAADLTPLYRDGICLVALQSVTSTDLIPSAIASALQILLYGTEEPHDQIINYMREKHLLLVLDNFEHLLGATSFLSDVLTAAPNIKILTTSRERLNIQEEWTLAITGLPFPNQQTTDALEKYEAVQLFVGRAKQAQSTFSLKENAESVKVICQQVEGMPLGIELAASWLRVMICPQIVTHMTDSLAFLTTPLRNVPERHRSIRAVFEQSWNLLSDSEQKVLMKLSVFRGGFDLEAAQAVAGASLTILASLVDKSLVRLQALGRYDLHELLRQYAADKLAAAGETINTANHHLLYFMKLAEDGERHAYGSEQVVWYDRQETEMDNLRAALAWSLSSEEIEVGLRMAAALRWVWEMRGHLNEGFTWFKRLLPATADVPLLVRAKALHRACEVAGLIRDHAQAHKWGAEALRLSRLANDHWNIAWSLSAVGYFAETLIVSTSSQMHVMLAESLALFRQLDEPFGLSHVLRRSIHLALANGDYLRVQPLLDEALSRDRAAGDKNAVAWELIFLGNILSRQHQSPANVLAIYRESITLFREVGDMLGASWVFGDLADFERSQGNNREALAACTEGILLLRKIGLDDPIASFMATLGGLIVANGELKRGGRVMAAAYARLRKINIQPSDIDDKTLTALHVELGEEAFNKVMSEGEARPWERAVAYALGEETLPTEIIIPSPDQRIAQSLIEPLTDRELEVLRLVAKGYSNQDIAHYLYIGVSTVKKHINHIYDKLDTKNRTQAVAVAREWQLLD
jgi:predicted ATPase/DNA-binding CsgD family transcriptional regulator